jgi:DNA-binding NarL/FixJ family response regulator
VISLVIADDHAVVREGLVRLLAATPDIEVLATARDGEEAVQLAEEHRPRVVLMDLSMPNVDGAEATRRIVAAGHGTEVVILTSFSDREQIMSALDAGAIGYLLKDAEPSDLVEGIRAAARGESPLDPKAARAMLTGRERPAARSGADPATDLTAREREVLALVAEGLPNKLISRRLEISEKTVKAHLTSVFSAIGVTDRTQAALWAREHGVVRPIAD